MGIGVAMLHRDGYAEGVRYCRSFAEDAGLKAKLFELLETSFGGITAHAARIRMAGAQWEETSIPFVVREGAEGRCIAHVGLLAVPLVIDGRAATVGGVHAVCTHPEHRGRGHFRKLMEEMLAWTEGRFQTLILFTANPALYTRFGFRVVQEHRFDIAAASPGGARGFRAMDIHRADDLHLLEEILDTREPVSQVFGVTREERGIFSFDCPDRGLWFSEELGAIVWMEVQDGVLRIFDIVAAKVPTLAEVLRRIPERVDRVEVLFSPDRLGVAGTAIPYAYDGHLMVRGPLDTRSEFMVPPTAHC